MTTETLMTEGQSQQADAQQTASAQTDSQQGQTQQAAADAQAQTQQQADQGQQSQAATAVEGEQGQTQQAETSASAPEQYEFQAPEGKAFDPAVVGAYSEIAKELNLSQESAQKVLDKVAPVIQARQAEHIDAVQTEWANSARNDKEFGGEKLDENLGVAKSALEKFGSPELKKLLTESGVGNHPEIIRAFFRVGKAMSEDKIVTGGQGAIGNGKSKAEVLYDKSAR